MQDSSSLARESDQLSHAVNIPFLVFELAKIEDQFEVSILYSEPHKIIFPQASTAKMQIITHLVRSPIRTGAFPHASRRQKKLAQAATFGVPVAKIKGFRCQQVLRKRRVWQAEWTGVRIMLRRGWTTVRLEGSSLSGPLKRLDKL